MLKRLDSFEPRLSHFIRHGRRWVDGVVGMRALLDRSGVIGIAQEHRKEVNGGNFGPFRCVGRHERFPNVCVEGVDRLVLGVMSGGNGYDLGNNEMSIGRVSNDLANQVAQIRRTLSIPLIGADHQQDDIRFMDFDPVPDNTVDARYGPTAVAFVVS